MQNALSTLEFREGPKQFLEAPANGQRLKDADHIRSLPAMVGKSIRPMVVSHHPMREDNTLLNQIFDGLDHDRCLAAGREVAQRRRDTYLPVFLIVIANLFVFHHCLL